PVHIILLEMIVHPVSAYTFENLPAGEGRDNSHKHSGSADGFLDRGRIVRAVLAGAAVTAGAMVVFRILLPQNVDVARATAFSAILTGNVGFVLSEIWPILHGRFAATAAALSAMVLVFAFMPVQA